MQELADSPIGRCVPVSGWDPRFGETFDTHAFLPDDLPEELVNLPASTWAAVADAMHELGRLDAAAALIPNPQQITRLATRREAIGTSALEGTYANLTDLLAAEAISEDAEERVPANVREVMNYTRAAEHGYAWVRDRPITRSLIDALQTLIVRETSSDGDEAGSIRQRQVYIGGKNRRVTEARFIPPPPGDQLRVLYDHWVQWIEAAEDSRYQLIVRVALAHYQFETIHPYTDGNGRLGRLIAILQILRDGTLRAPVLSVSPWLKDHDDEYRDHLLEVSRTGEWGPWVEFFARAVAAESRSGHDRIVRLLALREELAQTVRQARPRARLALEIAEDLIAYPLLSVAQAETRHGRTNEANRQAVALLVELGVLAPFTDVTYDRVYWNERVFQIINQ